MTQQEQYVVDAARAFTKSQPGTMARDIAISGIEMAVASLDKLPYESQCPVCGVGFAKEEAMLNHFHLSHGKSIRELMKECTSWREFYGDMGETICPGDEYRVHDTWRACEDPMIGTAGLAGIRYRTRRPASATSPVQAAAAPSKRTPLGPEDIPPGSVLRANGDPEGTYRMILAVRADGVVLPLWDKVLSFKDLCDDFWRIRRPNSIDWRPACK